MTARSITSEPVSHVLQAERDIYLSAVRPWKQRLAVAVGIMALSLGAAGVAQAQTLADEASSAEATQLAQEQIAQEQPTEAFSAVAPPADPSPKPTPFEPVTAGIIDLSAGDASAMESVGHLRPSDITALADDDVSWLKSAVLPLYVSPAGEHWGWIYQGWLIPKGQAYLAIGRDAGFAMVRAYENLYTFPVLEVREDGWFRVQYTTGGSAWAHTSQLSLGEVDLVLEGWEERLQAQSAVHFLQTDQAQPLRSQPELANNMLSLIAADSLIEPIDFAGDWMRVRVTRPTAACSPLTGATVTEGWMRWRNDESQSLVWYDPNGSCQQG